MLEVRLLKLLVVDEDAAAAHLNGLAGQADDALDVALGRVVGEPEDDDVAALYLRQTVVDELVDEDALAVVEPRQHRGALDLDRLRDEDEHERHDHQRKDEVAEQQSRLAPEVRARLVAQTPHLYVAVVVDVYVAEGGHPPA